MKPHCINTSNSPSLSLSKRSSILDSISPTKQTSPSHLHFSEPIIHTHIHTTNQWQSFPPVQRSPNRRDQWRLYRHHRITLPQICLPLLLPNAIFRSLIHIFLINFTFYDSNFVLKLIVKSYIFIIVCVHLFDLRLFQLLHSTYSFRDVEFWFVSGKLKCNLWILPYSTWIVCIL